MRIVMLGLVVGGLGLVDGCGDPTGAPPQDSPPRGDAGCRDAAACQAPTLCRLAAPIECGMNNSSAIATTDLDLGAYTCAPPVTADVTGPEVVYDWTATNSGTSYLQLSGVPGGTLALFEATDTPNCISTCLAIGTEVPPVGSGMYSLNFEAVLGHHYVIVADSPAGGSVSGHTIYWFCP